ncbi:energy-coupling factor transporter transmembrane component T family protein [Bacillus mesophilus]|uniref:Energy-coupling factor transporter transmembrane protein EcfT n=1 Tax=Bacillus mesophilus TaxID=1808955 RepID=A0A6M0QC89_9BACI|nr:energy-coupling factor transporter transmembrane component T [Bacillus mesophilus]NEY73982.1 energy-coupling factor transporter transmembrane protein EcfT [Bacillus mesophilus]
MMDSIIIGKYVPTNSIFHRMDPRSKLLLIFIFVLVIFLANNVESYVLLVIYTIIINQLTKVPIAFVLKGLKPVIWIILFTFSLHIFMTKEGALLFEWGWISIYEEGLRQGIFISIRFFLLIVMTSLLTLTTTPIEVTDGMESLLHPFKRFKLPVHELALMMSISLRFIPTLMQETEKIMKAQAARGVEFSSGPMKERIKAVIPLLVPLFINSFRRAEELANAMEARGYRGGEGRTKLRELKWRLADTLILSSVLLITICLLLIRSW